VDLDGTIASITPPNLMVGSTTVVTDSTTQILKYDKTVSFSDLSVGDSVHIDGTRQADGTVLASRIRDYSVGGSSL